VVDEVCRMPRREALDLALGEISAESLQTRLQTGGKVAFRNEREIDRWFLSNVNDFARDHYLTHIGSQLDVWPGRIIPSIDHVFLKPVEGRDVLVLVELKDSVNYGDIGQVLAQRNGLLEGSRVDGGGGVRISLYQRKMKKKAPYQRDVYEVEIWLVGQTFEQAVYFAAVNQPIHCFRITEDKRIERWLPTRPPMETA